MDFEQLMAMLGSLGGPTNTAAMGSPAVGAAPPLAPAMPMTTPPALPGITLPPVPPAEMQKPVNILDGTLDKGGKPPVSPLVAGVPAANPAQPNLNKTANLGAPGMDGISWAPPGQAAIGPAQKAPSMAALAPMLQGMMQPKPQMPAPAAPGITPGHSIDPQLFSQSASAGGGLHLPGIDLRARLQGLMGRG